MDYGHDIQVENLLGGARQRGMILRETSQLQPEVGLHRSADVRRTAGVDAPATIFILVLHDIASGLVKAFLAARAEQRMEQNIVEFEGGIDFHPSPPLTLSFLLA